MDYKIKSQNTLSHLSLHDCTIDYVEWVDKYLVFYLESINVLKTHPLNNTGKAKIARNVALIFDNALELSCFYYDLTEAKKEGGTNKKVYNIPEDSEIIDTNIIDLCRNIDIFEDKEITAEGKKIWTCSCNAYEDAELKIKYSNMWVCFDILDEDS
jgi:hypothetical protein